MKRRQMLLGVAMLAIFAIAPQALAGDREARLEPNTGMAFGAFDVTDSDLAVTHVVLMRISPARMYMGLSGERATVTYQNGEFYSPNLAPGLYAVNGFFSGGQFFGMERSLRTNRFRIEPGKSTYAGSYKLNLVKGGVFRRDKGSFARIDSPDAETTLRAWFRKELAGTPWTALLSAPAPQSN